jgi:hypothetical protein
MVLRSHRLAQPAGTGGDRLSDRRDLSPATGTRLRLTDDGRRRLPALAASRPHRAVRHTDPGRAISCRSTTLQGFDVWRIAGALERPKHGPLQDRMTPIRLRDRLQTHRAIPPVSARSLSQNQRGWRSVLATHSAEDSYCSPGPGPPNGSRSSSSAGGVTTSIVAGSGPRPAANSASSVRVPESKPSIPKFPSWHRGSL